MSDRLDQLQVTADLHLDIDGVQVQISGQGQHIDVATEHPARLLRAVLRLARATGVGQGRAALTRLSDTGLTVSVFGRSGELVRAGAGAGRARVQLAGVARRGTVGAAAVSAIALLLVRRNRH